MAFLHSVAAAAAKFLPTEKCTKKKCTKKKRKNKNKRQQRKKCY